MKLLKANSYKLKASKGFSLIEVLMTMGIFLILAGGIYFTYANILEITNRTRLRTLGNSLLNKELEIIRNLPYDSVGIVGGFPVGVIMASRTVTYEANNFVINAYVRNLDDSFDGVTGGSPNDTAPADHRIIELVVSCPTCIFPFAPIKDTTWVSPQNLEASTQNGSLFINTFDANGLPVANADVRVVNNSTSPTITIVDSTNNSGTLQLVDVPTSTTAYQITITKSGYSSAKTYKPGAVENPNPLQAHATVASQQITEISFGIDRVSTLNAQTQDYLCAGIPSISISQTGIKLIGANPDIVKYSSSFTTDTSGQKTVSSLEWDTYAFVNLDSNYDLAGTIPLTPLTIDPNKTVPLTLVLEPKASTSLLVTVTDASGSPLLDTSVNINKTGTDLTQSTGERFITQTNWSGAQYTAQDGNLEDANPAGELHLLASGGEYPTSTNSYVISNTFDLGTATTTLHALTWNPVSQPAQTSLRFQLAANNDNSTWTYVGPDGTGSTYYTATSTISSTLNNKRYLRYQAYFNTTNQSATPTLSDVAIGFTSACTPSGQTLFSGIANGTYTITASKSGYTTATSSMSVVTGWQEAKLILQ